MPTEWPCRMAPSVRSLLDYSHIVVRDNVVLGGFNSDSTFIPGELLFFGNEIHSIFSNSRLHTADGNSIRVLKLGATLAYS